MASIEDVREFADEIEQKFGANTSIAYAGVSNTQLSIARHFGGCKIQGHRFVYNPTEDSLIREDVVKWIAKRKKKASKPHLTLGINGAAAS
jgi:Rps23 Pro-64 3,4-dihydroxylase Tpa1-like proline 4-hydroxylase